MTRPPVGGVGAPAAGPRPADAVLVAAAPGPLEAAIWVDALRDAGIQAAAFERGVGAALGGALTPGLARYPVLVPRASLVAARNVLAEIAGGAVLAPVTEARTAGSARGRALLAVTAIVTAVTLAAALPRVLG